MRMIGITGGVGSGVTGSSAARLVVMTQPAASTGSGADKRSWSSTQRNTAAIASKSPSVFVTFPVTFTVELPSVICYTNL